MSRVTVLPDTLHACDAVEKATGLPEPPPVAETVNAASVATLSGRAANEMAWLAFAIVKSLDPLLARFLATDHLGGLLRAA